MPETAEAGRLHKIRTHDTCHPSPPFKAIGSEHLYLRPVLAAYARTMARSAPPSPLLMFQAAPCQPAARAATAASLQTQLWITQHARKQDATNDDAPCPPRWMSALCRAQHDLYGPHDRRSVQQASAGSRSAPPLRCTGATPGMQRKARAHDSAVCQCPQRREGCLRPVQCSVAAQVGGRRGCRGLS